MHNKTCGCKQGGHSCQGRKYPTKEEKKAHLLHKQECLSKELQGIKEALEDLN